MNVPWTVVLWSGFLATTLAASLLALLRTWRLTLFSPSLQLGCFFLRDPRHPATEVLGLVLLFGLGSTLVPALYFLLMVAWNEPSWYTGVVLGALHGAISVLFLPFVGTISACVRSGHLSPPGWFGLGWGRATAVGVLAGHVVYGGLLGAVLAAF